MENINDSIVIVIVTSILTALLTFAGVYLSYKAQIRKQQDDVEAKLWNRLKEEFDRLSVELEQERSKRRELEVRVEKLEDEKSEMKAQNRELKEENCDLRQELFELRKLLG